MKKINHTATHYSNSQSKQRYSNSSSSQRTRILKYFENCPRLSTLEARQLLGIMHPSARIMELRQTGWLIDTHWVHEPDANGVPHRIGLYLYKGCAKGVYYANKQ